MNAKVASICGSGFEKLRFIWASLFFLIGSPLHAFNPLIYQQYTADPTACWFNNRMYIYCSHDITGQTGYSITNVYLMSSDDLVNWTDEGIPFSASNTSWAGLTYAPDTISRNGFYYLYYGNGGGSIGVARSTSPTGPFTDPLGHSLVSNSTPGTNITYVFDPAAFIDDDGQAYLYFGGGGPGNARVIKLNSDMISVSGSAVSINAPRYFEAPFMNKVNGTYYFSYSTDFSASPAASIDYMTSSNPMTGFTHRGTILNNPPNNCGNNDHASIVNIGSNYYIAYHNRALALQNGLPCSGNAVYQRSVNLDRVTFNSDGTIALVSPTTAGVAALKNQNPFTTLRAVMMAKESGLQTGICSEGGMDVTGITNGSWTQVRNLNFNTGASSFTARVAGAVSGGTIQIHLDSTNGTLIGTLTVPNTGGSQTWQNATCPISGATGIHDVFFVFSGSGFNFQSYNFTASNSATNTPTRTNTPMPPTSTPTRTFTAAPPTATPTFTRTNTPVVSSIWRVNAGGPSYSDSLGNLWAADENFSGGSTIGQGTTIAGTSDATLYDTQRYGTFSYSFNVPAGNYQVTLKLAETYSGNFSVGARTVNVAINGTSVLTNLDIFAQVGSNTADDKVFNNVSPSGGVITIQFTPGAGTDANAVVEALQVIPQPATPTSTSTRTSTATRTNTPVPPTATNTATATNTSSFTRTNTPVLPTSTFTATATRTATLVPPTATDTVVVPTFTPSHIFTFTPTMTPVPPTATNTTSPIPPTATNTSSFTRTNTPVPPTSTFTSTSTRTATPVPPTATDTVVVPTFTPSHIFTFTPTMTPVPPTATRTNTLTATPSSTATRTPVPPTNTFTAIPPTATRTNTPVVSSGSLKVQLLSGVTSGTTNSPHPQIQVVNTGTGSLNLNNVTVRYWFNCDCTGQISQAWVDWAGLMPVGSTATGNVHVSVSSTTLGGQTNYVLYTFTGNMVLQPGQAIQVQSRFNKSDWSNMSQSNDWSFAANTSYADDAQVTGYISGGLVWGQEPRSSTAALSVSSAMAFPNPSTGNGATLAFTMNGSSSGTSASAMDGGQTLLQDPSAKITLSIYTTGMRLIWTQTLTGGAYGSAGEHQVYWDEKDFKGAGLSNGIYILRVTVESNGHTTSTIGKILILG